jgi:hypothetical protein
LLAPRQHHLDRDDPGTTRIGKGRPWWRPLWEWPAGIRFEDVSAAELAFERLTDRKLSPMPVPAGAYGCAAAMRAMSRFAETEI